MVGAAISQSSPYVGMAFGYYGLAWSGYSTVIGRGGEVQFEKNAIMDIKFGARTPASQFLSRKVKIFSRAPVRLRNARQQPTGELSMMDISDARQLPLGTPPGLCDGPR